METLKSLVPPLDLCKKIPDGKFEESALVWYGHFLKPENMEVVPRGELGDTSKMFLEKRLRILYPAPTLQEILEDLPTEIKEETRYLTMYDVRNKERGFQFGYTAFNLAKKKVDQSRIFCAKDDNAVISALKLWMKINKLDEANEANGTNKQKGEQNENGN